MNDTNQYYPIFIVIGIMGFIRVWFFLILPFILPTMPNTEEQEYKIYKCPIDATRIYSCEEIVN